MHKAAILIDGGFLLRRLPVVRSDIESHDAPEVARAVRQLVRSHLEQLNKIYNVQNPFELLYRTFYYDARPYDKKAHTPVANRSIDYAKSRQARFRTALFAELCSVPNLAVRLGEVKRDVDRFWMLRTESQRDLLVGRKTIEELTDEDFRPSLRQKGVDMRVGVDIASITLKRQAQIIILVSGDADFVPAAKIARREGVQFILDPLWQDIPSDLFEHIDGLRSGVPRPRGRIQPDLQRSRKSLQEADSLKKRNQRMQRVRIEAQDPESGKRFSEEADNLDQKTITDFFADLNFSDEEIRRQIARLNISADAKEILYKLAKTTIRAGEFVIRVGQKILDVVCFLLREFPKATFGLILGALLGSLVINVPVIGFLIGPLIKTLAMITVAFLGLLEDIKDKNLKRTIQEAQAPFETLKTA